MLALISFYWVVIGVIVPEYCGVVHGVMSRAGCVGLRAMGLFTRMIDF